MADQRTFFRSESLEYFRRNYEGRDLRDIPLVPILQDFLAEAPLELDRPAILDVGCGAANNLRHLCDKFDARLGVGTEPSSDLVEILNVLYPEFEFYESTSAPLPFESESFDLVLLRSVLHWVDRRYLLQTIGEALRVSARYLLVSDFSPAERHSTVYEHSPRYRTYKMSYRPLVEASGFVEVVSSMRHDAGDPWSETETVLYERIPFESAFPVRDRTDQ